MICDKCGKELPDNADFCGECGAQLTMSPNHVDETDMFNVGAHSLEDVPANSKKKSTFIVGVVAVLVVAILLVALIVKLVGGDEPATKSVNSVQKTALAGAEFEVSVKDGSDKLKVTGFYNIDTKEQTAEFYCEYNEDGDKVETAVLVDGDKVSIYQYDSYYEEADVEVLDMDDVDIDSEILFELLTDLSKKDIDNIDYEKYLEEFDVADLIEDYIEPKDVDNAVEAVFKALDKNAEECLGVEKDGKTYSYDIDIYETIVVVVEAIEKYVVDEDDYEDLVDFIDDYKSELKDIDNIEFEVTYNGKYVSEFSMDFDGMDISVTFENVGKCKETLDEDILDAIADAE